MLAVAGALSSAAGERPGEAVHVQAVLEQRGYLADNVDVHGAVEKLRRRYGWEVEASSGRPGYCLMAWPFRFKRHRRNTPAGA
jgi:hypothetical protein